MDFPERKSLIYTIRVLNSALALAIGMMLCSLVAFLIWCKSPSSFHSYRKMLMLGAAVDFWAIGTNALIIQRTKSSGTLVMVTYGGLISLLGPAYYCFLLVIFGLAILAGACVVPVQFYYRYYYITRKRVPSIFQMFAWFLLSGSLCFFTNAHLIDAFCPEFEPNFGSTNDSLLWFDELPRPKMLVWHVPSTFRIQTYFTPVVYGFYFVASLFIGWLTMRALEKEFQSISINETVRKVQRQLSGLLFAQCLIPLFSSVLPRIIANVFIAFSIPSDYVIEIVNMVVSWAPICNLLATIIFIKHYRQYCWKKGPFHQCLRIRSLTLVVKFDTSIQQTRT